MEEDTTLLHTIVLMYANLCTIAHTTLLHFLDTILLHDLLCFFNDVNAILLLNL